MNNLNLGALQDKANELGYQNNEETVAPPEDKPKPDGAGDTPDVTSRPPRAASGRSARERNQDAEQAGIELAKINGYATTYTELPSKMKGVSYQLPDYVVDALSDYARAHKTSQKYVLLEAIQKLGIVDIRPVDMSKDLRKKQS